MKWALLILLLFTLIRLLINFALSRIVPTRKIEQTNFAKAIKSHIAFNAMKGRRADQKNGASAPSSTPSGRKTVRKRINGAAEASSVGKGEKPRQRKP